MEKTNTVPVYRKGDKQIIDIDRQIDRQIDRLQGITQKYWEDDVLQKLGKM